MNTASAGVLSLIHKQAFFQFRKVSIVRLGLSGYCGSERASAAGMPGLCFSAIIIPDAAIMHPQKIADEIRRDISLYFSSQYAITQNTFPATWPLESQNQQGGTNKIAKDFPQTKSRYRPALPVRRAIVRTRKCKVIRWQSNESVRACDGKRTD